MYFYFVGLKGGASHHLTWLPYKKHITIFSCFFSFFPHFLLFLHQSEVKKRIGKNVKKHTLAYKRSAKQMYGSQNIQHALVSFFCSNLIFRFSSSRNSVSFSSKAPTAILEDRIRVDTTIYQYICKNLFCTGIWKLGCFESLRIVVTLQPVIAWKVTKVVQPQMWPFMLVV